MKLQSVTEPGSHVQPGLGAGGGGASLLSSKPSGAPTCHCIQTSQKDIYPELGSAPTWAPQASLVSHRPPAFTQAHSTFRPGLGCSFLYHEPYFVLLVMAHSALNTGSFQKATEAKAHE